MAVKSQFLCEDFADVLSPYALGVLLSATPIAQGAVQTNYLLHTTEGRWVFKYYENRSLESVLFEANLLAYLKQHGYPCPVPFKNREGADVSLYRNKPFVVFEFVEGHHIEHPRSQHKRQLIQKAAELHQLTQQYQPLFKEHRWNYGVELCKELAGVETAKLNSQSAIDKLGWLEHQLSTLQLPPSLPKGISHCDFHFSNALFRHDELVALLDFDDANCTFLLFDLVCLMDSWAWPHQSTRPDLRQAHNIVHEYMNHRLLSAIEKYHLYDVYKLSILLDCVWFFNRGTIENFYEGRKIGFLNQVGRNRFHDAVFLGEYEAIENLH